MGSGDKWNQGYLMRRQDKRSETDCEFSGTINIEGKSFYLKAWVNQSKDGRKYLRLAVRENTKLAPNGMSNPEADPNANNCEGT